MEMGDIIKVRLELEKMVEKMIKRNKTDDVLQNYRDFKKFFSKKGVSMRERITTYEKQGMIDNEDASFMHMIVNAIRMEV